MIGFKKFHAFFKTQTFPAQIFFSIESRKSEDEKFKFDMIEFMTLKFALKILIALILAAVVLYLLALPDISSLAKNNPKTTSLIDRRIQQAQAKGKILKPQMAWRKLSQISPNLIEAVLLAEDDTFYRHEGFDWDQILIAVKINWRKKRFAYGGSTITQQLARTLYLSPSKNILRKLKEALITFWMEKTLTKRRILELYLNVIEWGDGIYGAEAAAQYYYHKSCADLTSEESVNLPPYSQARANGALSKIRPF